MCTNEQVVRAPAVSYAALRRHGHVIVIAFGAVSLLACTQKLASADDSRLVSGEPSSATLAARPKPAGPSTPAEEDGALADAEDDVELRRGYGAVDMRFNPCVTRTNDYTLSGEGCPSGFVIYGPYVPVPAKSEIEVSFELRPSKRVEVYSDVVTRMAAQTLAGLSRQVIDPGVKQKLGYRVYVFNADVQVESRIGMTAEPGTAFEVTNLTMRVR